MQSGFLHFKNSNLHYLRAGKGDEVLLCFHGYGESALHFSFVLKSLQQHQSGISIDLPFHGETDWKDKELMPGELHQIIQNILLKENLRPAAIKLVGFSMGGRMVLSLFEHSAENIKKLILLAPDGMKLNFWYWVATQSFVGKKLFKFTMYNPGWFLFMLKIGNKMRLINQSIYKFVTYYIHDRQVREDLYNRWMCLRKFKPDLKTVREKIEKNKIPVRLLYGKYDRIILTSPAKRFTEGLENTKIELLECGHQVLHEKNVEAIMYAIND